jgi:alkaline phosphatase
VLTADHETGGLSVSAPKGEMLTAEMLGLLRTQRRSLEAVAAEVGGGTAAPEAAREAVPWLPEKPAALTDPAADGRGPFLGKSRRPYADAASGGAGVVFSTDGHTATPVPILALGPGAERFGGVRGNDEAGRILRDVLAGR